MSVSNLVEGRPGVEWERATLGSLAEYINGRAFKPEEWTTIGVPIIRIQNLTDPEAPANHFNAALAEKHRVETGDLLVSWSATLDVFWWERGPAALNQHIFKVRENPKKVDRLFLFFLLKSVIEQLRSMIHGSTMKHVTKPKFEGLEVRIPRDLAVQKSMAAELRERLDDASRMARALESQREAAQALIGAAIEGAFQAADASATGKLVDVLGGPPRAGWSPPCDDLPGGVRVLTLTAVTGFQFRGDQHKLTSEPVDPAADYWVQSGDLLMTRSNTPELVGHVAIADAPSERTIFPDLLMRLPLDRGRVITEFAHVWLMSSSARNFIRAKARGSSGTMKKVNQQIIRSIPFPSDVPLDSQTRLVAGLREQLTEVRVLNDAAFTGSEAGDALHNALVREAFDIPNLEALTESE